MNACPGPSFHGNLRCRGAEATRALSSPNTHLQMQKTLRISSEFQKKGFNRGEPTMVLVELIQGKMERIPGRDSSWVT